MRRSKWDSDRDTEHQIGAGEGARGGAARPTARGRQHWSTAGVEVGVGYPHPSCSRI